MKTLSTPITTEAAAEQSAWVEIYDIYLKSAINTPWGSTNVLRLCNRLGKTFSFFTPTVSPEAVGTQGAAASYYPWPLKRAVVKSSGQFTDSKLEITASNVTAEWATMLSAVNWYDTPVVIRKTSPNLSGATSADCVIVFSGLVDAVRIDDKTITLVCSNDLALLNRVLPSENMHANCRFKWADDQCTAVRFKSENYKNKTVGSSSTTTRVKSSGLTEDTGSAASYGTDLVNPLSDLSITASSYISAAAESCYGKPATDYIIADNNLADGMRVRFGGTTVPSPLVAGTFYYVINRAPNKFQVSSTAGGSAINITSVGTAVTYEPEFGFEPYRVKSSYTDTFWAFGDTADWGTVDNAYYSIPDAQAGMKNAALKPYIQFDFGSAKTPKLWRVSSRDTSQPEERLRIIQFFSSTDASTWTFESYYEMPNRGGEMFDVLIPKASSARYWRICVRSRWAESLYQSMFAEVQAYELSRHWWQEGLLTFKSDTTTAALRNVSRKVLESYDGEVVVQELSTAPASGDTFIIERGCARTFNACCARSNTENYGGFNDLPTQTVIR